MTCWFTKFRESCSVSCKVVGDMGDQQVKKKVICLNVMTSTLMVPNVWHTNPEGVTGLFKGPLLHVTLQPAVYFFLYLCILTVVNKT